MQSRLRFVIEAGYKIRAEVVRPHLRRATEPRGKDIPPGPPPEVDTHDHRGPRSGEA